jgi:hypothetical protein
MELMISAATLPSLLLCLCCLWCQVRSQWKATRKIGNGVSDGRWEKDGGSAKGRRFTADDLPGIGSNGELDEDGSPRKRGPKQPSAWRETAARAKEQARECKQQNSWQSIAARSKEQARERAQPHRPSPMPPGRSASSRDSTSICKSAIQPNIVAPRAKRPPPAPPSLPLRSAGSSSALPIGIGWGDGSGRSNERNTQPRSGLVQERISRFSLENVASERGGAALRPSSTISHRPPPPPPLEGAATCWSISPQRSASTSPYVRTYDTSGLCASRTPPAPIRGAMGAASQSSAASAASEGAASSAHAPRYVKRVVDASASRVKRPPPPPPIQDGSSTTSRGAGGSTPADWPSPEQQREAEARTREVFRSGTANARARTRQAAESGDAQGPASAGAGAADT